jgi:Cdc6-like AAA superfamily ATPase
MFRLFINPSEETYSASSVSMVPTVDVVRLSFLISVMMESHSMPNIMVSGKSGVGKSQLLTFLSKSMGSVKWRKAVIQSVLGKPQVDFEGAHTVKEEDLRKDSEEQSFSTIFYHASTQLQSQRMQSMLGSCLMRQGKSILIPPTGKKVSLNEWQGETLAVIPLAYRVYAFVNE